MKTPIVTCLLDGGWTQVNGSAIKVVARSNRKMKVDSVTVVGWQDGFGTFMLLLPDGGEVQFSVDGTFRGRIPASVPAASAAAED